MVILKVVPGHILVRAQLNIRSAHVLVDGYVSQVMDMEMSN